jgi:hypothetical protein
MGGILRAVWRGGVVTRGVTWIPHSATATSTSSVSAVDRSHEGLLHEVLGGAGVPREAAREQQQLAGDEVERGRHRARTPRRPELGTGRFGASRGAFVHALGGSTVLPVRMLHARPAAWCRAHHDDPSDPDGGASPGGGQKNTRTSRTS